MYKLLKLTPVFNSNYLWKRDFFNHSYLL